MVTDSTCSEKGSEKGLGKGVLEQKGLEQGARTDQKGQKVLLVNNFGKIMKFDVVPAAQNLARVYFVPNTSAAI